MEVVGFWWLIDKNIWVLTVAGLTGLTGNCSEWTNYYSKYLE